MPGKSAPVRHAHPAEHDVIPLAELMNIEAEPGAHITQFGEPRRLRLYEIILGRELHVARLTLKGGDSDAGPLGERGIVTELIMPGSESTTMGLEQWRKGEGLRRLHEPQIGPVHRLPDPSVGIDSLDCIRHHDT